MTQHTGPHVSRRSQSLTPWYEHLDRFEQAWKSGKPPRIDEFLRSALGASPATDERTRRLLQEELVKIDLECRWRRARETAEQHRSEASGGERPPHPILEDYVRHYPEVGPLERLPIGLILEEYRVRSRFGRRPESDEYFARFPHLKSVLPERLAQVDVELAEELASGSPSARGSKAKSTPREDRRSQALSAQVITGPDTPPADTATDHREGAFPSVAGYEILGELGRGGMGVVYKARHVALKRVVALKMILGGAHVGREHLIRFRKEAEAVARLQHPNIVQIHEIGEQNGLPFFSLEFVEGGSLDKRLAGTPQPGKQAAWIVETLARAMQAAHEHGIVHRDLKPANVLVTSGKFIPKITDFGLAKQLDAEAGQTRSGAVMGTPSYMAPEQARGEKAIGPAADVYALGAILYELLTGRPPFKGPNVMETLRQVATDEPVPPSRFQPKLPRDLETICLKCLEKQARSRYASAEELAEELRRFQAGEPIRARAVTAFERAVKWANRHPAVTALSAAIIFVTVLGFTLVTWKWSEAVDKAKAEEIAKLGEADARRDASEKARAEGEAKTKEAKARRDLQLSVARRGTERGLQLCEQGYPDEGLLWLADALTMATEAKDDEFAWAIRSHVAGWGSRLPVPAHIFPHEVTVSPHVTFTPDSKLMLTSGADKLVRLWDVQTGRRLQTSLRHEEEVLQVAVSPDGKRILTATIDGAFLWETATGTLIGSRLKHDPSVSYLKFDNKVHEVHSKGFVTDVSFSPDGTRALTAGSDKTVRFWDTATGKPLGGPFRHKSEVDVAVFSPDGKTVLTGSFEGAQLWEVASGKKLGKPMQHEEPGVRFVIFTPDGKTIVTGGQDRTVRAWEAGSRKPLAAAAKLPADIRTLAMSPDGKRVLVGLDARSNSLAEGEMSIRVYETSTLNAVSAPIQYRRSISAAVFSPDGKMILTGSPHDVTRLWDTASGKPLPEPLRHPNGSQGAGFSPDGKSVWTVTDAIVRLWGGPSRVSDPVILPHSRALSVASFTPDGKTILTGGRTGCLHRWDRASGKQIGKGIQHRSTVWTLDASPDGKTIVTGTGDMIGHNPTVARLWDRFTGKALCDKLPHQYAVTRVRFSPSGKTFLTASSSMEFGPRGKKWGEVKVWSTDTAKPLGQPMRHEDSISAALFSADGKTILTSSMDKTARVWDAATGHPRCPPMRHKGGVWSAVFSPDGKTVLTGSEANNMGEAQLWDAATGKPIGNALPHRYSVISVAVHPNGKILLTGSGLAGSQDEVGEYPGEMRLWDLATGQPLTQPFLFQGWITHVSFRADGKIFCTNSQHSSKTDKAQGQIQLWSVETTKPIGPPYQFEGGANCVSFSPDGSSILAAGTFNKAYLWSIPPPVDGTPDRILLQTQINFGKELDAAGAVLPLTATNLQRRMARLQELASPPAKSTAGR